MGNQQTLTCRIYKQDATTDQRKLLRTQVEELGKEKGFSVEDTNFTAFPERDFEKYEYVVFSLSPWYYSVSLAHGPQQKFDMLQKQIEAKLPECEVRFRRRSFST
jgi:hypothetical protein